MDTISRAQMFVDSTPDVTRKPPPDYLSLAAASIERGDDAGALPYLVDYLVENPQATMIRAYLAELHLRLGNHAAARSHYERFISDAGEMAGAIRGHLVHAQTRLMEIAQKHDDAFEIQLRRGIGLVCLVRQWEADRVVPEDAPIESTLVKAAAALRSARDNRPGDPRPHLYLAEVYTRLGQPSAARAESIAAQTAHPGAGITTAERGMLSSFGH